MMTRLMKWFIAAAAFVSLAGTAFAQGTELLKYDIKMDSALQMNGSTYVLQPGEYRLEQVDMNDPNVFMLRQKEMNGTFSEPIAILDTWHVPYYETDSASTGVHLVTDPHAGGVAIIKGWQIGQDYWRLRDVATLDTKYFSAR